MQIVAGKTYVSQRGYKYYVIGFSKNGQLVITEDDEHNIGQRFYKDGKCIHFVPDSDLVKEWKEPIVHRRDVVWYRHKGYPNVYCDIFVHGHTLGDHIEVLKRETVEYTEEL